MQDKNKDNKNVRNRSTNIPSNPPPQAKTSNQAVTNTNIPAMNRSGNGLRKPENVAMVKLPKVPTVVNSSVSNSSMKAIW